MKLQKKRVDEYLDEVDYSFKDYIPSIHALTFLNFIKEINGEDGEENETPLFHLKMMDSVFNSHPRNAILVHRGGSKTSLFAEYLTLYKGAFCEIPDFGKTNLSLYISDSIENGVKNLRRNVEFRYRNSDYLQWLIPQKKLSIGSEDGRRVELEHYEEALHDKKGGYKFTDIRLEFQNRKGETHITKSYGILCLGLDEKVYLDNKTIPIKDCKIGDYVATPKGTFTKIVNKSIIHQDKKMYKMIFKDGRELKVTYDHINPLYKYNDKHISLMTTQEIYDFKMKYGLKDEKWQKHKLKTYSIEPIEYSKKELQIDPYTLGVTISADNTHIPEIYLLGSIEQRLDLLGGLLDTDGGVITNQRDRCYFDSISNKLIKQVANLVRSLGGSVNKITENDKSLDKSIYGNKIVYRVVFSLKYNPFKLERKKNLFKPKDKLVKNSLIDIVEISIEDSVCIEVEDSDHLFVTTNFIPTHNTGIKGPLALDEIVYTNNGTKTIAEVKVGDKIFASDGSETNIIGKSDIFNDPMYELVFADGRKLKVNHNHINPLLIWRDRRKNSGYEKINITTEEILKYKLKTGRLSKFLTEIPEPLNFSEKDFLLDPYLIGIALGDGWMPYSKGLIIGGLSEDIDFYKKQLQSYDISYRLQKNSKYKTISIHGITKELKKLKIAGISGEYKFIPKDYFFGSIEQRRTLLAGLLDTDGSCSKDGRVSFSNISKQLCEDLAELARGLGYYVSWSKQRKAKVNRKDLHRLYIRGSENPFMLNRKAKRWIKPKRFKGRVPLIEVNRIDDEPSQCIQIEHKSHEFITTGMLVTHNTKELGQRPIDATFDDVLKGDDAARSQVVLQTIKNSIYKDVAKALHPKKRKMIYLGTPYNQSDPLYEAIESGSWTASVFPIAEQFDATTTKENFRGSWEDRFSYEYVKDEYDTAISVGEPQAFYQELMLRITNKDDLLIQEEDIKYYDSADLINKNKKDYNFYITTDFAVTAKASADNSTISVWAYDNNQILYWVNGFSEKCTIDISINRLFDFVKLYNPMEVGIERSGQQGAIVTMVEQQMFREGLFFNLGKEKTSKENGFNSTVDKISRFNTVVPMFKLKRIFFPRDMLESKILKEGLEQIKTVSSKGYATKHDDFGDTIAMISKLTLIKPSIQQPKPMKVVKTAFEASIDEAFEFEHEEFSIKNYIN